MHVTYAFISLTCLNNQKFENLSDFHDTANPLNLINQSVSRAPLGLINYLRVKGIEL